MDHGARVFKKGLKLEQIGKKLFFCLLGGIAILILIAIASLIMGGSVIPYLLFAAEGSYKFVNFLDAVAYLGIVVGLIGIPLYFLGLIYVGLGQIAENTKKGE